MSRRTKETLTCECVLTDDEKLKYSKELSESISKKQRADDSLKSFSTQIKSEIASCEAKIDALADKLNSGREYRAIECSVKYDFDKKEKTWVRLDTGEIAKTDIITEKECQEEAAL